MPSLTITHATHTIDYGRGCRSSGGSFFLGLPVADDLRNLALLDGLAGPNRSLANPYGNCRAGFDRLVSRVGLVATKP